MEQVVAQFSSFPQSPKERISFVEKAVDEITSGERNPLEFEVMLKNLEDTISMIRKDERVKNAVMQEASKYVEKVINFGNYEISKISKSTYDYSNDETWNRIKKELKNREEFLKSIKPEFGETADTKTGEILAPPIKKVSEYLTIKHK